MLIKLVRKPEFINLITLIWIIHCTWWITSKTGIGRQQLPVTTKLYSLKWVVEIWPQIPFELYGEKKKKMLPIVLTINIVTTRKEIKRIRKVL